MWDFYNRTINEIPDELDVYVDFIYVGQTLSLIHI